MTFNRHVRLVVSAELGAVLQRGFTGAIDATAVLPRLLYVLADCQELRDAVEDGTWPAPNARFSGEAALDAYALPLLHSFIKERRTRDLGTPECRFGDELVRDFHPVGSHFDRYIVRMFEGVGPALDRSKGRRPYALGMRTAELDMAPANGTAHRTFEVSSAIYDAAIQRNIMEAIFTSFETYYEQAVRRFGHQNAEQVLASCWDGFRQAVGAVLPRFRPPHLSAEREWITVARWQNPARFQLVDGLLVPALSLRSHARAARGLPLERTVVHDTLLQQLTADSLRQFYRFHKVRACVVVAASTSL